MSNSTEQITDLTQSFKKGWGQLKQVDVSNAKEEIMAALHITTNPAFYSRLNGSVEHKPTQIAAIEGVFAKYGITEIWGN